MIKIRLNSRPFPSPNGLFIGITLMYQLLFESVNRESVKFYTTRFMLLFDTLSGIIFTSNLNGTLTDIHPFQQRAIIAIGSQISREIVYHTYKKNTIEFRTSYFI